jgi:hypothetical protein
MSFSGHIQTAAQNPLRLAFHDVTGSVRCLWWPPRDGGHPSNILLFTCGYVLYFHASSIPTINVSNPGLPEFYIPFLSIIRERLQHSSLAICAHGHIGHAYDLPQPKSDASLLLQAQMEAAAAIFRNLQRQYPNTPFIFVGHSIGAYIALHVSLCHLLHVGNEIDLCRRRAGLLPVFG